MVNKTEIAIFGEGCFWCAEAIYQQIKGVISIQPGYAGGITENPTYQQVCTSSTGHAEVIRVEFDPRIISYRELLEVFWSTHDPTSLNRQGNDVGTQYRSIILYSSDEQRQTALESRLHMEKRGIFSKPIITEITPLNKFYAAEDYHQDYFKNHQSELYCQMVIRPKLEHFTKDYAKLMK